MHEMGRTCSSPSTPPQNGCRCRGCCAWQQVHYRNMLDTTALFMQLPTQHAELSVQRGNVFSHPSMSCNMSQLFARPRLVKLQTAHTQAAPTFATPTLLTFAPHPASCLPIGPCAAPGRNPGHARSLGHDKTIRSYFNEPILLITLLVHLHQLASSHLQRRLLFKSMQSPKDRACPAASHYRTISAPLQQSAGFSSEVYLVLASPHFA